MSPRSVDSSATKAVAPSPVSVIPLPPDVQHQFPTILRDPNTRIQGDKLNPSSFAKAAEQKGNHAGGVAVIPANLHCQTAECAREAGQDAQVKHSSMRRDVGAANLSLPFKTAHLQKLADAALSCKKVCHGFHTRQSQALSAQLGVLTGIW